MNDEFYAEGVSVFFHRQGIFSVRLLEGSWATMCCDHSELFLRPLLHIRIAQLNRYFTRAFHHDWSAAFLAVHIHCQIGRKALKVFLPPRGLLEGLPEHFSCLRIVGDCRLFLFP